MWCRFLTGWNGISFFLNDNIELAADMHLYTDSTDRAFGGYYQTHWFSTNLLKEKEANSMAFLEYIQ